MKRAWCVLALLLVACLPDGRPQTVFEPISPVLQTAYPGTPTPSLTPTWIPAPTATPTPTLTPTPTATPTPTPWATLQPGDAVIGYVTANASWLYFSIRLPVDGDGFWAEINDSRYTCTWARSVTGWLSCAGPWLPPRTPFTVWLHAPDDTVIAELAAAGYEPPRPTATPILANPDWVCEVEPLWVPPLTGPHGCYAATCYSRSSHRYVGGTQNSCEDDFPYYLYITPKP